MKTNQSARAQTVLGSVLTKSAIEYHGSRDRKEFIKLLAAEYLHIVPIKARHDASLATSLRNCDISTETLDPLMTELRSLYGQNHTISTLVRKLRQSGVSVVQDLIKNDCRLIRQCRFKFLAPDSLKWIIRWMFHSRILDPEKCLE